MRTLLFFLSLWTLHNAVSSSPPSPINVSFSSVNLRNVLHWFPGNGTPHHTHYTVEYAIYGDSTQGTKGRRVHWRAVQKCTEIVRTWCDLSRETEDEEQGYYARVRALSRRASSKWTLTQRRFDPKSDTTFGPPMVSVELENNSVIITLTGPMRYLPKNHTSVLSMQSMAVIYPQMTYNLSINNTHSNRMHHVQVGTSLYKYRLMDYNNQYCFSARAKFLSMPIHCQSSPWHCITTPQDPVIEQLRMVVVGIVVPAFCICIIAVTGYLLHHYMTGKGQKSPPILNLPSFPPPSVTFSPENPNHCQISAIKVELLSEHISAIRDPDPEQQQCNADPPPSYSPDWSERTPEPEEPLIDSEPEEPLINSTVDYGFVSTINVGGREEERRYDEGDNEKVDGHSTGVYLSQEKSSLLQKSKHMFTPENVPLLSSYASQNIQNMPTCHPDQSDFLPDNYGVVRPASTQEIEEDHYDNEEQRGTICVNWDPETKKLVIPGVEMGSSKEGQLGVLMGLNRGKEDGIGGEDEEPYMMKDELRLENVFVRQGSEEEAEEARREFGKGGETERQVDDILAKWNLVISMDE